MRRLIPGEERFSKARFEAFTDGVFAIAITLLVLEIHIPDLQPANDASMSAYLQRLGVPLLTYVLSFATVGIIWLNHHASLEHVTSIDRTMLTLNLLLLAVVCFVPFPTALLSRYGALPSSTAFYGATMTLMSVAYGATWQYATRREAHLNPEAPPMTWRTTVLGSLGTVLYFAGSLLAFVAPRASIALFIAIAVYYLLPGLFRPPSRATG